MSDIDPQDGSRQGRKLRLDPDAPTARADLPASLATPKDAPVYHGFPLVRETLTDGWCYGAITEYEDCEDGYGGRWLRRGT